MRVEVRNRERQRPFYGWVIVGLAGLCAFWGVGGVLRSFPVILQPLTESLAIPRTAGVAGVTLGALVAGLAAPLVGRLVDRGGARALVAGSALVTGGALCALAWVQDAWLFLLLFGGVLGLARPGLQAVGAQATVARWFVRRRGQAVTYSTLGMPLSAVVLVPLTQWVVAAWGWRAAWLVLGLCVLAFLAVPTALFLRGRPEDVGLRPDGDTPAAPRGAAPPARSGPAPGPEAEWTTRAAARTPAFWLLSGGFALVGMVPGVMTLHMFPHFTDQGLDPALAAAATGSFGLYVIGSRILFWGRLFDRVPMRHTLVLWACLMTGAMGSMLAVDGPLPAFVAAGCYGIAMGATAPLGTLAWASYFGRRSLGSITGLASLIGVVNDVGAPLLPSLAHDLTGSYAPAFLATTIACVVGVAMLAGATPPRPPSEGDPHDGSNVASPARPPGHEQRG